MNNEVGEDGDPELPGPQKVEYRNTDQIVGHSLIGVQQILAEGPADYNEVVLHFSNGGEISIYVDGTGTVMVEGD